MKDFSNIIATVINQASTTSLRFYKESFRKGGFTDKQLDKWEPRANISYVKNKKGIVKIRPVKDYVGRALLIKTGTLRRSLRKSVSGNTITIEALDGLAPYAKYHNEGIKGRLPKRQFIAESESLNTKLASDIEASLKDFIEKEGLF